MLPERRIHGLTVLNYIDDTALVIAQNRSNFLYPNNELVLLVNTMSSLGYFLSVKKCEFKEVKQVQKN